MARHTLITLTVEELEAIKEAAAQRAEELEWQLRRELARLREVEGNLARMIGEPATPSATVRRLPLPPPPPQPRAAHALRPRLSA